ncbi:MAG: uncharacterized protein A8A55_2953 [Amphiamblys sp. WSBS2006]|nr:MAG: uncharacterized protein A8A55_2953 [Amphiamblys sp. WSBS2006]
MLKVLWSTLCFSVLCGSAAGTGEKEDSALEESNKNELFPKHAGLLVSREDTAVEEETKGEGKEKNRVLGMLERIKKDEGILKGGDETAPQEKDHAEYENVFGEKDTIAGGTDHSTEGWERAHRRKNILEKEKEEKEKEKEKKQKENKEASERYARREMERLIADGSMADDDELEGWIHDEETHANEIKDLIRNPMDDCGMEKYVTGFQGHGHGDEIARDIVTEGGRHLSPLNMSIPVLFVVLLLLLVLKKR